MKSENFSLFIQNRFVKRIMENRQSSLEDIATFKFGALYNFLGPKLFIRMKRLVVETVSYAK